MLGPSLTERVCTYIAIFIGRKSNGTGVLIIHVPLPYDSLWLRIIGVGNLGLGLMLTRALS